MKKFILWFWLIIPIGYMSTFIASAQDKVTLTDVSQLTSCQQKKYVFRGLHIPTDKKVTPHKYKMILKKLTEKLILWNAVVLLEGHADVTQTPNKSLENSKKRVNLVKNMLIEFGVPADKLSVTAKGEFDPPFPSSPKSHDNRTVVFQVVFCPPTKMQRQTLKLATGTRGGTYYPVGKLLAEMWSDILKNEGIKVEAILTQGSPHNVELLRENKADLAIVTSLVANQANQGAGWFEGDPYKDLRGITAIWHNVHHFIISSKFVQKGNVDDLDNNLKFCVGRERSSNALSANRILDALAKNNVIRKDCGGYNETVQVLLHKDYDGASLAGGVPVKAVENLFGSSNEFKILEFTNSQTLKLDPAFLSYTLPANTYPKQSKPIETVAELNILVAKAQLDNRIVRLLSEKLFENLTSLRWAHKALKEVSLEKSSVGIPIPMHSGVISLTQ
ncbi:TAXI family TRAP transporter solute-binding subunit [Desulfococcaceae bacterium HSG7]|nr:TAXI family TRAP transporter solute-binding subunit [Desulfococcaceae bacterium HSG7]